MRQEVIVCDLVINFPGIEQVIIRRLDGYIAAELPEEASRVKRNALTAHFKTGEPEQLVLLQKDRRA